MSTLTSQIKEYIATTAMPSLQDFIWSNMNLFSNHQFKSQINLIKLLRSTYKDEIEKQEKKLDGTVENDFLTAASFAFKHNVKATKEQRSSLIALYFTLAEDKDVSNVKEKTKADLEALKALNTTNPATQLDKLALELLSRYNKLNHNEIIVLKLALSHIVSFLDNDHITLYKSLIEEDNMWKLWDAQKKQMDVEEEKKKVVEEVFGAIIKVARKSLDDAIKYVLKEQLELLDKNQRKSFKYQMLEAASYLLHNVEGWEADTNPSEAEVVSRVSGLLKIIFNDTDIEVTIGETTADCTKANRVTRESLYSGGSSSVFSSGVETSTSSNISGRKIDMKFSASNGIEVALCEFKKNMEVRKLTEQQGKCCRLNLALLEDLKSIKINDRILAITWGGGQGRLVAIEEAEGDVFVAYPLGNVEVPFDRLLLDDTLKESMNTLCQWKTHIVELSKKTKINNLRFGPLDRKRDEFDTLFTPKLQSRKRQRISYE